MYSKISSFILWLLFLFFIGCSSYTLRNTEDFNLTDQNNKILSGLSSRRMNENLKKIGNKIWQNESGGTIEGLTSWNEGEDFPSLGIGHFIWQRKGSTSIFGETWPELIQFMKSHGKSMPSWVRTTRHMPWESRKDFLSSLYSPQMKELRTFLLNTIDTQTQFIAQRLLDSLPKIIKATPNKRIQQHVQTNFYRLARTPQGLYALIDYVNFKGEGLGNPSQYNNTGWGLRQVLTAMPNTKYKSALVEFSNAVKFVLRRRVENAPAGRNEKRWLQGWYNRADTYKKSIF